MATPSLRTLGLASILGGSLGFPVSIFLGAAYLRTAEGAEEPPIVAWHEALRSAFPAALEFAGPDGVYLTYGRFVPLVFLGFLAGLWGLHGLQQARDAPAERITFYSLFGPQALFTVGLIIAYFTPFLEQAFILMIVSLLLSLLAALAYGIVTLRRHVVPNDVGWFFIVAPFLWLPGSILLGHNSLGLVGFYAAAIRIGVLLRSPMAAAHPSGDASA